MLTYDPLKLAAELKLEEGLRLDAYLDTEGVWTIGYGHTGPEVKLGLKWTQAQADAALDADIRNAVSRLSAALPWASALSDARTRALLQMTFQLGINGLLKFKHMLEALRLGAWDRAYSEALDSDWARQTPARAQRIAGMLRNG